MADAYVIESAGVTAGIVVAEKRGLRFYASEATYHALDGKSFASVGEAQRAVRLIQHDASPRQSRQPFHASA